MVLDELIARLVLSKGLVSPDRLGALRAAGDTEAPRPLEQMLLEEGLIDHQTLAQLLKELWGGASLAGAAVGETATAGDSDPNHRPTHTLDSWDVDAVPSLTGDTALGLPATGSGQLWISQDRSLIVRGILGKGGMGVVYLVMDPRLRRLGALKVLRKARDPGQAELRFQREAVVTARLDHPGVAPVYEAGRTLQGDAFLLMRYLPGKSLGDRIQEIYGLDPRPPIDVLRPFLQNLVRVCEAVAFAHSQGIVHRDLKPDNVVLGSFGEVCVVDWGLARDVLQSPEEDAKLRAPLGPEAAPVDSSLGLTQQGAMLGTLGFMPPEQARGEDVDPSADVFSLGAILAQILTGRIPFEGETVVEVATNTGGGEVVYPHKRRSGLDPELRAIAIHALDPEPDARYRSARALGEDLESYLQGRPVSVLHYGPAARAVRFVKKHPALFAGLGAATISLILGVVAIFTVRAEALRADRAQTVARAKETAIEAQTKLELSSGDERRTHREEIAFALGSLSAAQGWHVLSPKDEAAARRRFDAALELARVAKAAEQWPLAAQAYEEAAALGVDDVAARLLLQQVVEEASAERRRRRSKVARWLDRAASGELTRQRDGINDAVFEIIQFPEVAPELLRDRLKAVTEELLKTEVTFFLEAQREGQGRKPIPGLEAALAKRVRGEPLSAQDEEALGRADGRLAKRALRKTRFGSSAIRPGLVRRLLGSRQSKVLGAGKLDTAQLCCAALGRLPRSPQSVAALATYLNAESDEVRAVAAGLALCRLGAVERLIDASKRFPDGGIFSTRIEDLLSAHPVELPLQAKTADGFGRRGRAQILQGNYEAAIEDLTRALELGGKKDGLYLSRGLARFELGAFDLALADYDAAIAASPKGGAEPYTNRGNLYLELGRLDEAVADYTRALKLDPSTRLAYLNRAVALRRRGDFAGAEADLSQAIALEKREAEAWAYRGNVRRLRDDFEGATQDLEEALRLDPQSSFVWQSRAKLLIDLRRLDDAHTAATRAIELKPGDPVPWTTRGMARLRRGDVAGGHADCDQALSLNKDHGPALAVRAECRSSEGDLRGAIADLSRAVVSSPKNATYLANRGNLRREAKDLTGALEDCDKAVALDPGLAEAWGNRAIVKMTLGDLAGADFDIAKSLELNPKLVVGWYNRGNIRRARGKLIEALADFSAAIDLDPRFAPAWANRGLTRAQQGDLKGAVVDLDKFLKLDPHGPYSQQVKRQVEQFRARLDATKD